VARGPAGNAVVVKARPAGATDYATVATIKPAGGRWRLSVAPRITTRYLIGFAGDATDRLLRVRPDLRVARGGGTIRVSLRPAAPLAGDPIFLFRLGPTGAWSQVRQARIGRTGVIVLQNLPNGRYYVGYQGGDRYWSTASEPFTVRR